LSRISTKKSSHQGTKSTKVFSATKARKAQKNHKNGFSGIWCVPCFRGYFFAPSVPSVTYVLCVVKKLGVLCHLFALCGSFLPPRQGDTAQQITLNHADKVNLVEMLNFEFKIKKN